jgi:alginate O-acetyltransferase complex protein AlgI
MLFNSLTFLYFFVLLLTGLYSLPPRLRNAFLLGGGFVFYMSWSPIYVLLLLATAGVDYFVALKMAALQERRQRKPWLVASMVFSVGSLLFFKYTGMAVSTAGILAGWFGSSWRPPIVDIVLPLGISFYTFETISYGVDVYRGELQPKRSFFEYLSFLMFFPKLIAGPIVRASELLPQIARTRAVDRAAFTYGINALLLGYCKKVLLADNFAPFVEKVFASPHSHNRWMNVVAAIGYSMQVYFDFSAYTDIAHGCARLLGYELPKNFNRPYAAVGISDFWRRWHMTLSRWLRDYFYIPIGGKQPSRFLTYRNLFLTMLVGGLWHGANWTFVAWGAMNGVFLLVERAWHDWRGTEPKRDTMMALPERIARGLVVFTLITFTRIFFRSPTFAIAIDMIRAIVHPSTTSAEPDLALFAIPVVSVAYVAVSGLRGRWMQGEPRGWRLLGIALLLLVLLCFGASQAEFIYFQF